MNTPVQLRDFSSELKFSASRSGGAGGQNVNKVNTKVELSFDLYASLLLSDEEKAILAEKLASKVNAEGILKISSQTDRTQLGNKEACIKKFYVLVEKAFVVRKKRKATKPTAASKEKRLDSKRKQSELKSIRQKRDFIQ